LFFACYFLGGALDLEVILAGLTDGDLFKEAGLIFQHYFGQAYFGGGVVIEVHSWRIKQQCGAGRPLVGGPVGPDCPHEKRTQLHLNSML
jgi:hypothetical protein